MELILKLEFTSETFSNLKKKKHSSFLKVYLIWELEQASRIESKNDPAYLIIFINKQTNLTLFHCNLPTKLASVSAPWKTFINLSLTYDLTDDPIWS